MSETEKELDPKEERARKAAILRKAMVLSVVVFTFGIGLFVLLVMAIVRFASKTPGA